RQFHGKHCSTSTASPAQNPCPKISIKYYMSAKIDNEWLHEDLTFALTCVGVCLLRAPSSCAAPCSLQRMVRPHHFIATKTQPEQIRAPMSTRTVFTCQPKLSGN